KDGGVLAYLCAEFLRREDEGRRKTEKQERRKTRTGESEEKKDENKEDKQSKSKNKTTQTENSIQIKHMPEDAELIRGKPSGQVFNETLSIEKTISSCAFSEASTRQSPQARRFGKVLMREGMKKAQHRC